MKKKNGIKNIFYSFFGQFLILLLGFLVPRIILKSYGSDTNGLINTITQIFTYLALLEAGIAQATTNSLYKYLHEKKQNKKDISRVMTISQRYFKNVSKIYALLVVIFAFTLPFFLKTNLSYSTVSIYIFLEGIISVISFYYIQSWNALLLADGKNYIVVNIDLLTKVLCYFVKILMALKGINIIYIQVGCLIVSLIKLFVYKKIVSSKYGWIEITDNYKNEKLENKSAYLISEIAWTIFSSTDMIILSIFCSTQYASVYSIYNMVFLAISSLLNSVYNSLKYILGNAYFNKREEYATIHDLFNSTFFGIMTALMCVAFIFIIPFVKLYTEGINDINYVYSIFPLLFCLVQMLSWSRYISGNLTAIAGYAKNTSYASILEAFINLSLSLLLVKHYGIIGVLIATVCALPFKVFYCNYLADKVILKRSCKNTIAILGINWIIFFATVFLRNYIKININSFSMFILYGCILSLFYLILVIITNLLINKSMRLFINDNILSKLKGKINYGKK